MRRLAFPVAVAAVLSALSCAQAYPTKPMRVIASSAPGGISDIFMRALGEELQKRWGQPVVIENRSGGNFNIGSRACAESPPDGYTICIMSNEAVTYNLYLYKNLPVDVERAIAPVTNLFFMTQALAVNAGLGVRSVSDLVALAKSRPRTFSYSAPAAPLVLYMDNLNKEHGIDLVKVPFKGGGDAINGVLSGVTLITFLGIGNMLAHLEAGRMTALLTDGDKRAALLPGVPALKETGYKGPVTRSYFALYAPTGVPKAMLEKIATDVRSVAGETGFRERNLVRRGLEPVLSTPDEFAAFLKQDRAEARRVVDQSGLAPQ
ncbi:MAG TPA: tripartite tricarboxylate transporter substrate binding protein [Xanthobacteraceae bacterium]